MLDSEVLLIANPNLDYFLSFKSRLKVYRTAFLSQVDFIACILLKMYSYLLWWRTKFLNETITSNITTLDRLDKIT